MFLTPRQTSCRFCCFPVRTASGFPALKALFTAGLVFGGFSCLASATADLPATRLVIAPLGAAHLDRHVPRLCHRSPGGLGSVPARRPRLESHVRYLLVRRERR